MSAEDVPGIRSIRAWRQRELTRGPDEPWLLSGASAEDAKLILPALLELIRRTEGRLPHLTQSEAAWICKLLRAQPSMPVWEALKLARRYIRAGEERDELLALDRYVALALWSQPELQEEAINDGVITIALLDEIDDGDQFGTPVYRVRGAKSRNG